MTSKTKTPILLLGASALAVMAVLAAPVFTDWASDYSAAYAADDGEDHDHEDGEDGKGKPENAGSHEDGEDHDHEDGEDHEGGQGGKPEGAGSDGDNGNGPVGGEGEPDDSDGQGPQANKPEETGGGAPVWAAEGIPEVELGRLNVARSPEHVLDRAYEEALASFTEEMAAFYSLSLDEAIEALSLDFDEQSFVDSPLQNLALLRDALDGSSVLNTLPQVSNDNDTLLALFLGAASDKTVVISPDTVLAIATIYGVTLSEAEILELAANAEAVRIAILAGHG